MATVPDPIRASQVRLHPASPWASVHGRDCAALHTNNGRTWGDVQGGRSGAVEVAIVRNAVAHGSRIIDAHAEQRLRSVGVTTGVAGSLITLSYTDLREFRARLLSLLRFGGIRR